MTLNILLLLLHDCIVKYCNKKSLTTTCIGFPVSSSFNYRLLSLLINSSIHYYTHTLMNTNIGLCTFIHSFIHSSRFYVNVNFKTHPLKSKPINCFKQGEFFLYFDALVDTSQTVLSYLQLK